jgi:acyl-coenzyme A thioesterase 9
LLIKQQRTGTFRVRVKPENTIWMEETLLKNVIICFPEVISQLFFRNIRTFLTDKSKYLKKNAYLIFYPIKQRNLYNKIFGGFLMRQAYELAWINACLFSKMTPKITVVDDITFKQPVLIGSLLFLTGQVVYTENNVIQVKVHAQTVDPKTNIRENTNDFYFKFTVPNMVDMPQVIPKSYAEAMMYIDGKRHL